MARVRSRLTFANVTSLIALFIALGGAAYAVKLAPRNSVISGSILNGQVKRKDLARHAVTGAKVAKNSLSGTAINESKLGTVPNAKSADSANHATSAGNATQLGGLDASAYEHADQVTRFGPLLDSTPGMGDGPTASSGPFTFELFCRYISGEDIIGVASSEAHSALTWTFSADNGSVQHFYGTDQGSAEIQMASSSQPSAYVKSIEGWALSPSGFRTHFSLWFGRGILGADGSTCSFGGEFRRG